MIKSFAYIAQNIFRQSVQNFELSDGKETSEICEKASAVI